MGSRNFKTVMFLCTGNYYRSRFAEILFNTVAERMGLAWRATSCGLALERGIHNVGPISKATLQSLKELGVRVGHDGERFPKQADPANFDAADHIIALKETEHRPLMQERYSAYEHTAEYWEVDDVPGILPLIEREVMALAARLITGLKREGPPPEPSLTQSIPAKKNAGPAPMARLRRETKGRRGKGVTIVDELPLDDAELRELATKLKERCGTGGSVKDRHIEIQGDQRDRVAAVLKDMGYRVKFAGG